VKKSLLLLTSICSFWLLDSCGGGSATSVPLVATHFSVTAPGTASAGTPFNVTVTALDASNSTVISYSGPVEFISSDGQQVRR